MQNNPPFTYSNYSTLRQCGRKFKYRCIDKLPTPRAVALEFGSALHAGLADALTTQDPDSAIDVFQAYWEGAKSLDFSEERFKWNEMSNNGVKFVANFLKRYGSKMELIVGEKRMYGVTGEGTPDALVAWNGANVLLDYKSSAYNYHPLKSDISLQLNLYALLLEENGYKVDSLCYFVFNKGTGSIQTPLLIPFDRKKALEMRDEAILYWKREQGHFERNSNACIIGKQVCAFAGKCWGK